MAGVGCFAAGAVHGKVIAESLLSASPVSFAENLSGGVSFFLTAAADLTGGYSGIDPNAKALVVGENTLVSATTALLGVIPSSDLDFAAQIGQVWWDENGSPTAQLRIGLTGVQWSPLP